MGHYLSLVRVASIVVAAVLAQLVAGRIIYMTTNPTGGKAHLLATPVGSAILFALVFVVVWCIVSFILAIPWLLAPSRKRPDDRPQARKKLQRQADPERARSGLGHCLPDVDDLGRRAK
jgi:hypothetical protein